MRLVAAPPAAAAAATTFDVPLLDGDHVTDDTGTGFVHTAPGHGADDYDIWMSSSAELQGARHRRRRSPSPSTPTACCTKDAPGFEGKRVIDREGRQGRRQRRRHQGAGRGRRPHRARPPQAPVPALLALEEAGDLPQHAAVVHRHGQARQGRPQERQPDAAPARRQRHRRDRMGAAVGREPHPRHGRRAPRLGRLAPARLGRADHRVPQQGDGRGDPVGQVRQVQGADGPHHAGVRREGRRRVVQRRARRSASSAASSTIRRRLGAGARHPRRVVRFRLDARLHAGGPAALPDAGRRQARARRRQGPRHVPRRLRPAPRLVPVLAAGIAAARAAARPTTSC